MVELKDIFARLTAADLDSLETAATRVVYPAGAVLLEEGSQLDSFFVIDEGLVTVTKIMDGAEITVADLGDGEVVGEMSFIDGCLVSATVTATTDTAVVRLSRAALHGLIHDSPDFGMRLYHSLAGVLTMRLRQMTDQYSLAHP